MPARVPGVGPPGLSRRALREIELLERTRNYLAPGSVARALEHWRRHVADPYRRLWVDGGGGCGVPECCADPLAERELLEAVLVALSRSAARELRAIVEELDARY
ncbi:hypothetical protein H3146_25280 [Streptomyces sp. OF3]|uniref:Uncharacterized protein n=1 Tax=Streptomyces alkaliterrae TaxID=2213162 RepID=A0A7W3WR72_9ACTN|nr:hypothetical protein [Streptomyces alkaliterrae]